VPDAPEIDPAAAYTQAAAAVAGRSVRRVRAAIRSGDLPAARPDHAYRIQGRDLAVWCTSLVPSPVAMGTIDPEATYAMLPATRAKGVALGTIRAALVAGRLPASRDGQWWAIRGADLLAWQPYRRAVPPGLLTLAQAAAMVGVAAGALETVFDRSADGATIRTLPDGLWWAVTTVTMVGYGDTFPKTAAGRRLGVALMLVGVGLFGVITANLAAFFVEQGEDEIAQEVRALRTQVEELGAMLREQRNDR
jgi:ion channel